MGQSISVYAIRVNNLQQLLGSGGVAAAATICRERENLLSDINDIDDDSDPTCADAVLELVKGEISDETQGYL